MTAYCFKKALGMYKGRSRLTATFVDKKLLNKCSMMKLAEDGNANLLGYVAAEMTYLTYAQ